MEGGEIYASAFFTCDIVNTITDMIQKMPQEQTQIVQDISSLTFQLTARRPTAIQTMLRVDQPLIALFYNLLATLLNV